MLVGIATLAQAFMETYINTKSEMYGSSMAIDNILRNRNSVRFGLNSIKRKCEYCRSINVLLTNCKNCGAPQMIKIGGSDEIGKHNGLKIQNNK